eukprot:3247536-Amphidinium_carterae.2
MRRGTIAVRIGTNNCVVVSNFPEETVDNIIGEINIQYILAAIVANKSNVVRLSVFVSYVYRMVWGAEVQFCGFGRYCNCYGPYRWR